MQSKKKVVLSFGILFALILGIGITIITVLAATSKTIVSRMKINYHAVDIDGIVTAQSRLANSEAVDMETENGGNAIVFKAKDSSPSATSLMPNEETLKLTRKNKYVEFIYTFSNTGDAYYKDGNVPMAILFYERALKLDPSYEDARYNLQLLNSIIQDRIDPVPDFILKVWAKDICYIMDSNAWAICFIVLLAITLALALLFILGATAAGRRTGFFAGIVTLLLAAASLSFALWQKNDYMSADDAIVMRPVTSVKSSPSSEASTDLFILHEGTKVHILDRVGTWTNIELADGRQGWLQTRDLEVI